MKVKELIEKLKEFPEDMEVMYYVGEDEQYCRILKEGVEIKTGNYDPAEEYIFKIILDGEHKIVGIE